VSTSPPTAGGPSLAGRFAAAIALTIGFYVLALAIAGALLAAAILPWVLAHRGNLFLSITGVVLGVSMLVAIFPRRHRFEAPGLRVSEDDQPRLLALVRAEAEVAGEPRAIVRQLRAGELDPDEWRERACSLGIAELALGDRAEEAEPVTRVQAAPIET
jgi:hypothetical protein